MSFKKLIFSLAKENENGVSCLFRCEVLFADVGGGCSSCTIIGLVVGLRGNRVDNY